MGRVITILIILAGLGTAAWFGLPRLWPRPSSLPETRFFVIGDNHGPKQVYKELLQKAKAQGAGFVINVADLTEHGTEAELKEVLALERDVGLPVEHVIGSHDIKSDPSRKTWDQVIGPPYRGFERGGARFVLLDNADRKVGFSEDELAWLKQTLADGGDQRTFLFYHRPFGLPLEGLLGDDETPASRNSNDAFRQIIRQAKPTMLFSGHLHTYLPYTLEGVEAYVTGGGGDHAQTVLGGERADYFHGLLVTVTAGGPSVKVLRPTSKD